jgi:phosphoglycolate phosphatase-like HAD superfamily hydrolase
MNQLNNGLFKMIEKIYLDMDGVLCNFEKRYIELYKESPNSSRDKKNWSENWTDFVLTKQFETLDIFPGAIELLRYVRKTELPIEILTSSGGAKYHDLVAQQKDIWLKKQGLAYKRNVVSGRGLKASYATPDTILIDDTEDVIDAFNKAGGIGILHKDIGETLQTLDSVLAKQLNTVI